MGELWVKIEDFPMYQVSDYGRVMNLHSGMFLKTSFNGRGSVKVGLVRDDKQFTRGVAQLVGAYFVDGADTRHTSIIHLDGDPEHNHAFNLRWRTRSYAWRYHYQFLNVSLHHTRGPIRDTDTGERHPTIFDAAVANGLLVEDIVRAIYNQDKVYPTGKTFEMIN